MTHQALQPRFLRDNHSAIIIFSIMLLGFKVLVFHLFLPKYSEFSHKVSGYTALGKVALGFEDNIFPLILEFRLFNIEIRGNFPVDLFTMFHFAG